MRLRGYPSSPPRLRCASPQGEEVDSGLGVRVGVGGVGLAVDVAVGVGFVVGVGVGGGGAGMGMMKRTMLRTTIRLRTPKAIWRVLTCDLREPRFTAYLLVGGKKPDRTGFGRCV
jgi:hypothetical protein